MKHQTLHTVATWLTILAWVIAVAGIVSSIILGIGSATAIAKIGMLLGGFVVTGILFLMLLVVSKMILLFLDIKEDLNSIAEASRHDENS
jgi:hypothetical protein